MNLHQWDYYTAEGTLRPDAARAEALIDAVLERAPSHALAHHLRIHIAEPARPGHACASSCPPWLSGVARIPRTPELRLPINFLVPQAHALHCGGSKKGWFCMRCRTQATTPLWLRTGADTCMCSRTLMV